MTLLPRQEEHRRTATRCLLGTEESLGFRRTGWTRRLWATTSSARLTSTPPRWTLEKVEKHTSSKDYKTGFGGEFGVQTDRVDKNAVGWEHNEKLEQHESQSKKSDYQGGQLAGAGGHGEQGPVGTNYVKARPDIPSRNITNFKDRFEAMAKHSEA